MLRPSAARSRPSPGRHLPSLCCSPAAPWQRRPGTGPWRVHHRRMPLFAFEGRAPQVSPGAWVAPTATLVGDVRVEAEASVWYGAVLRADFGPIIVRRG